MFESSKLHCRLHCLGLRLQMGIAGMFFAWAHVFFFPFHKPNYYECAFFLAKPTTHARVVRHTILKRNGKKKPWAQTNNSLPNNHVRHNEASFNSTKWRCPYDNVTYCKFTPNRKQLPKQLPPPLHMARTWMDMHRLRRLHDSQYIMKNPFTNENSNLSNIFHNNIHRKKVESLKVRSTEEFLCQFAWLPCRFFRGRRQGRQPLIIKQTVLSCTLQVVHACKLVRPACGELKPNCLIVPRKVWKNVFETHGSSMFIFKPRIGQRSWSGLKKSLAYCILQLSECGSCCNPELGVGRIRLLPQWRSNHGVTHHQSQSPPSSEEFDEAPNAF